MNAASEVSNILEVEDLRAHLFTKRGVVRAVDGVSFDLRRGETLGIVGESGSGKSMTALSIVRLLPKPAGRIVSGSVKFNGTDLLSKSDDEMRRIRGQQISMILQDPQTSLNPVFPIFSQIREAFGRSTRGTRAEDRERVVQLLRDVQIAAPESRVNCYPHELSGGMKQRVVGAIAIASEPKIMIADEPTTALDLTIQLQYLELLKWIKKENRLSMVFITHDFGVVAHMCDRVAVMYAGKVVEFGSVLDIFDEPQHPYTKALIDSLPRLDQIGADRLPSIAGAPPLPWKLPEGCPFHPRCPHAMKRCAESYPPTATGTGRTDAAHRVACWLHRSS